VRAAVVHEPGPPEALQVAEVPEPVPVPGEISVDVEYAGVGFVDTLFRAGAFELPMPLIPGIEVTGRVRAVGPGVDTFVPGQPVGAMLNDFGRAPRAGGYAEVAVAHESMAFALAADADLAKLAGVLVNGTTAWMALHNLAHMRPGEDVLVLGANRGLGATVSRVAALLPARQVIGVVASAAKVSSAPSDCTTVLTSDDLGNLSEQVRYLTGGRGVDVVVDPVGGAARTAAFGVLAPFGRHLVLGNASGRDVAFPGDGLWLQSRQSIGLSVGGVAHLVPDATNRALRSVVHLVSRNVLREPDPAVVPLAEVSDVHRALEQRTAPPKTVLQVA